LSGLNVAVAYFVTNSDGVLVYKCYSVQQRREPFSLLGACAVSCTIRNARLVPGLYRIGVRVFAEGQELFSNDHVTSIEFEAADLYKTGKLPSRPTGVVLPEVTWSLAPALLEEPADQ
jgi:hypothetical protein